MVLEGHWLSVAPESIFFSFSGRVAGCHPIAPPAAHLFVLWERKPKSRRLFRLAEVTPNACLLSFVVTAKDTGFLSCSLLGNVGFLDSSFQNSPFTASAGGGFRELKSKKRKLPSSDLSPAGEIRLPSGPLRHPLHMIAFGIGLDWIRPGFPISRSARIAKRAASHLWIPAKTGSEVLPC